MPRIITLQGVSGDVHELPNGSKLLAFTDQVTGDVTNIPCGEDLARHLGSKLLLKRAINGTDPSISMMQEKGRGQ